jgi:hypothetical protein
VSVGAAIGVEERAGIDEDSRRNDEGSCRVPICRTETDRSDAQLDVVIDAVAMRVSCSAKVARTDIDLRFRSLILLLVDLEGL